MNREELIEKYSEPVKVLDHGWIRVIDVMGDDEAIEQAVIVAHMVCGDWDHVTVQELK